MNLYADVKFSQIIPSPPSSDGIEDDTEMLPPKIIHMISQEGIGLYIKTLSLLGRAMDIAGQWWFENMMLFMAKDLALKRQLELIK